MRSTLVKFPLIFGAGLTIIQAVLPLLFDYTQLPVKRVAVYFIVFTAVGFALAVADKVSKAGILGKEVGASVVSGGDKVVLLLPYEEVLALCKESVAAVNGRVVEESTARGSVKAITGPTWRSLGERITFNVRRAGDRITEVEVNSYPVLRTTILDYGKSLENVKNIASFLAERDPSPFPDGKRRISSSNDSVGVSLGNKANQGQNLLEVKKDGNA